MPHINSSSADSFGAKLFQATQSSHAVSYQQGNQMPRFFNIWPLSTIKINLFAKVGSKCCQTPSNVCHRLLYYGKSGEFSSNLSTLCQLWPKKFIVLVPVLRCRMSRRQCRGRARWWRGRRLAWTAATSSCPSSASSSWTTTTPEARPWELSVPPDPGTPRDPCRVPIWKHQCHWPECTNLRGSITVRLTSCWFCLDSAALLMLNKQQFYLFGA